MDLQLRIVGWPIGKAGYTTFYGAFPFAVVAVAGSDPPQWERCIVRLTSPEPIGYSSTAWYLRPPKIEPWRYHESPRAFRREWYIVIEDLE